MILKPIKKLKLHGFNNLTKTLSFNFYDICYASKNEMRQKYIEYIDEEYSADRLTEILTNVTDIIGAHVLNIAKQDYDPQGASVTILVAEKDDNICVYDENTGTQIKEDIVAHLDKSHITVHTYPECHPHRGISTFRADIDVSTCGHISPLKALDYLINSFEPDICIIDYRVRGFTRDTKGKKHYIDHKINSIQNYIPSKIANKYQMVDINIYQENTFITKMILKEFDLDNYLFGTEKKELLPAEKKKIKNRIQKEMAEIFYGQNIRKVKFKDKKKKDSCSCTNNEDCNEDCFDLKASDIDEIMVEFEDSTPDESSSEEDAMTTEDSSDDQHISD